jgi:hypothetical protein
VSEQEIAGAGMLRIDVPAEGGPPPTQFYSPSSVYCITPTTKEIARGVPRSSRPEPVHRWELPPAAVPAGAREDDEGSEELP